MPYCSVINVLKQYIQATRVGRSIFADVVRVVVIALQLQLRYRVLTMDRTVTKGLLWVYFSVTFVGSDVWEPV